MTGATLDADGFCGRCGAPTERRVPEDDHQPRAVCTRCGQVHYRNPKVIAGCIATWEDRLLMCRRAIEPRLGLWTFPAGFLELSETTAQGAAREAREEAEADVDVGPLFAVIGVPQVSQIYLVHRGVLRTPHVAPTPESSECVLMEERDIPWSEIAFPTVHEALRRFLADRARGAFGLHALDLPGGIRRG